MAFKQAYSYIGVLEWIKKKFKNSNLHKQGSFLCVNCFYEVDILSLKWNNICHENDRTDTFLHNIEDFYSHNEVSKVWIY